MSTKVATFTFNDPKPFIEELKKLGITEVFVSKKTGHVTGTEFTGINISMDIIARFVQGAPPCIQALGLGGWDQTRGWDTRGDMYCRDIEDRKVLHQLLASLKVDTDQLESFKKKAKKSLISIALTETDKETDTAHITEKTIRTETEKATFDFDAKNSTKPIKVTIFIETRWNDPHLKYRVSVPVDDEGKVDNVKKMLDDAHIRLIYGSVEISLR